MVVYAVSVAVCSSSSPRTSSSRMVVYAVSVAVCSSSSPRTSSSRFMISLFFIPYLLVQAIALATPVSVRRFSTATDV
ncbi:unnamed protein product [Brassica napus]|uniref:(rape) hypothetical protein n=1 Tax=Brassica napus TaxID=3708 RepID=A0A816J1S2_BRANA|nr:unnamed protein product [Brassica napus]